MSQRVVRIGRDLSTKGPLVSQRRTLILVAAIVIGMVAAFLVYNYVDGVEQDAAGDNKLVTVYMAKTTIKKGTDASTAGAVIVASNIPQKFKPENAITDQADISGQVAVTDLPTNQIIVRDQWVDASDPAARQTISAKLRKINGEDMTAISISVDAVRGVAGFINPGDYVNVMVSEEVPEATGGLFTKFAHYLFLKSEVLAVGGQTTVSPGATEEEAKDGAVNSGLITLIVPTRAAQYIASVPEGNFYLTLVADDYVPVQQKPLTPADPIPAEDAAMVTPYGPKGETGK